MTSGGLITTDWLQADNQMNTFAHMTGGRAYFPRFDGELPEIFHDIGTDIRNQYTIAYHPTNPKLDGSYRKLKVELVRPGRRPVESERPEGQGREVSDLRPRRLHGEAPGGVGQVTCDRSQLTGHKGQIDSFTGCHPERSQGPAFGGGSNDVLKQSVTCHLSSASNAHERNSPVRTSKPLPKKTTRRHPHSRLFVDLGNQDPTRPHKSSHPPPAADPRSPDGATRPWSTLRLAWPRRAEPTRPTRQVRLRPLSQHDRRPP